MAKARILILGISGSLGGYLANHWAGRFEVLSPVPRQRSIKNRLFRIGWADTPLDLADLTTLRKLLEEIRPEIVINGIAVTPGHATYLNRATVIQVNSTFPHLLAEAAHAVGSRVIHFSTDAVFSGLRGRYQETDPPEPHDWYGWSKLAGELPSPDLTLRTSFFGLLPTGKGLVNWLLQQEGGKVQGYSNYVFSGISVESLAEAIVTAMERKMAGLFHVGGAPISKLELLRHLRDAAGLNLEIQPIDTPQVDLSLDSSKFWQHVEMQAPRMPEMLDRLRGEFSELRGGTRSAKAS